MGVVLPTVESPPVTERLTSRVRVSAGWLVLCGYAVGAVAVTWRLWADPAGRVQVGDVHDVDLFAWFLRYEATMVAHGRLPALVTTAMNAPRGISLMWNTSLLLPGLLLTPVTLAAGPQVSLTVLLTAGFAGSAAALGWVLRRHGVSLGAAALGGAVYGFSPALLESGIGHYNLQFAVLPPLIIDALLRIVTGRGRPVRAGAWLGLLTAAQLLTGEELLADTALAGLVLVAGAAAGLGTGAAVVLLICGHALWEQFRGPLTQHYVPRVTPYTSYFYAHPGVFVTPPGDLLFHTPGSAAAAASYPTHLSEYLAYLGWPLLAVLAVAAVGYWRDPKVRAVAVTFAALELFSLGGRYRGAGPFLPWHWLQGLPVLGQVLPDRFAILADGAAAAVLAFSLDRARPAVARRWGRPGAGLVTAVAVLAVLPLVPRPLPTQPVARAPAGWHAAFARLRLPASARVLVVPIPYGHRTQAMRWQADTGQPGSLIGGFFLGPDGAGRTRVSPGAASADAAYLDPLWAGASPAVVRSRAQLRADLAYWRPAAAVADADPRSELGHILAGLLGPPTFRAGALLVWRL